MTDEELRARGFEIHREGKMVPDGSGGHIEQTVIVPPSGERDLWPYIRSNPRPQRATIYFLGPQGGPIKIGFATNLAKRLRDLELANAYPLVVWASIEAAPSLEREYHKRFAAHRAHGEWFKRCPEIEAEIARLNQPNPQ